jgi:hypothetical protein
VCESNVSYRMAHSLLSNGYLAWLASRVSSLAAIKLILNLIEWTTGVHLFLFLLLGENTWLQNENKIMIET